MLPEELTSQSTLEDDEGNLTERGDEGATKRREEAFV
jgi:hypothetical protein